MTQKLFCPNCGTQVIYGVSLCCGCGIHFKWITQAELERHGQVTYSLPPSQPGYFTQHGQTEHDPMVVCEKSESTASGEVGPLRANVSKLIESLFNRNTNCNQA